MPEPVLMCLWYAWSFVVGFALLGYAGLLLLKLGHLVVRWLKF